MTALGVLANDMDDMKERPPMVTIASNQEYSVRARSVMPGGVNSRNRMLPFPLVVRSASGATFTDVEGRTYLDYHAAFGPIVLGHNHPSVNAAVRAAMKSVDLVGAGVTELEIQLGEVLHELVPSAERISLVNSGSEATYMALRLARAVTGRQKIVKFQGAYHGWHDAVALNVISRRENIGRPDPLSLGMSPEVIANTFVLPFNDVQSLRELLSSRGDEIAAVLVEIVPHNIGCVLPSAAFLAELRESTIRNASLLVFDEVVTGFRHALGGYQSIVKTIPDLTVLAKAMANGYPVAALVGRRDLMERLAPGGGVFFGGTYNGHPMSAAAAIATIGELRSGSVYAHTFSLGSRLAEGMRGISRDLGIPMTVAHFGSVVVPYFFEGKVETYTDLLANNDARDIWFRRSMCERGIFMMPVALKRNHISAAHTVRDIDRTLDTARAVLKSMPRTVS